LAPRIVSGAFEPNAELGKANRRDPSIAAAFPTFEALAGSAFLFADR
jgi:hypothetical protein